MKKTFIPLGRLSEFKSRPDAPLYLIKAGSSIFSDLALVKFSTRKALEAFNKKSNLHALIPTKVPQGMKTYAHEIEDSSINLDQWCEERRKQRLETST